MEWLAAGDTAGVAATATTSLEACAVCRASKGSTPQNGNAFDAAKYEPFDV